MGFAGYFVWPRGGDLAIKVLRIEFETMANIAYHLNKIIEKYGENLIFFVFFFFQFKTNFFHQKK
jgi:hypothetical protein